MYWDLYFIIAGAVLKKSCFSQTAEVETQKSEFIASLYDTASFLAAISHWVGRDIPCLIWNLQVYYLRASHWILS